MNSVPLWLHSQAYWSKKEGSPAVAASSYLEGYPLPNKLSRMKKFEDLSESEILALAISLEEFAARHGRISLNKFQHHGVAGHLLA